MKIKARAIRSYNSYKLQLTKVISTTGGPERILTRRGPHNPCAQIPGLMRPARTT